jgi:hypothetical protein
MTELVCDVVRLATEIMRVVMDDETATPAKDGNRRKGATVDAQKMIDVRCRVAQLGKWKHGNGEMLRETPRIERRVEVEPEFAADRPSHVIRLSLESATELHVSLLEVVRT